MADHDATEQELENWRELARTITPEDRERHQPPAHVWDDINRSLGDGPATSDIEDETTAEVVDMSPARAARAPIARGRGRYLLLAGAAAVLAVIFAITLILSGGSDESVTTFVADITNDTLPESFEGTAMANLAVDDAPMLEIDFDGALPTDEPLELWLIMIDPESGEIADLRSLGMLNADRDSWSGDWPAGLDPTVHSIVDVSIEPDDGDPTHSGRSILRGQLTLS